MVLQARTAERHKYSIIVYRFYFDFFWRETEKAKLTLKLACFLSAGASPVSVVDHGVDDGVHLLGELGGVGGELLCRRPPTSLPGLAASLLPAGRVLVLASFAFALFQPDLLLHLLQVSVLDGLKVEGKQTRSGGVRVGAG